MTTFDTIVVGAGISGLTTAHRLARLSRSVAIVDAAPAAGGVIGTRRRDGFLYETGPNSTLDTTPLINALLSDLGIANERIDANAVAATRYVVRDGRLIPLPGSPRAFLRTKAFTLAAKLRLLREPFIQRTRSGVDESIATFARRRLGAEFLDYAIDPFVAGIYAGDPERISVGAAFPRLLALELAHGSLIKGQIAGARARKKDKEVAKNVASSFSFRGGMQTLTDALAKALPPIEYGTKVQRVVRDEDGSFAVEGIRNGAPVAWRASSVVVAAPAHATASMIVGIAPDAAMALAAVDYAPIAIVASAYRRADVAHSLAGFGFLVPRREHEHILGCLFSSSMFVGRAPEGSVLLTSFAGGRRNPEIESATDAEVASMVREELAARLGADGAPLWQEVIRWPQAIPQYDIGHLDRMRRIDAAEAAVPGLYFCANYRGGVAVGDRIKMGQFTAEQVDAFIAARAGASDVR